MSRVSPRNHPRASRSLTATALVGLVVALLSLLGSTPAAAIPPSGAGSNTPGTSSQVSPARLQAGDRIQFTVRGFPAGETVNIKIDDGLNCTQSATHGACVYHKQRIPSTGTVSGSFALPADLAPGQHWLRFLTSETITDDSGQILGEKGYTNRSNTFTVVARNSASSGTSGTTGSTGSTTNGSTTNRSSGSTSNSSSSTTVRGGTTSGGNRVISGGTSSGTTQGGTAGGGNAGGAAQIPGGAAEGTGIDTDGDGTIDQVLEPQVLTVGDVAEQEPSDSASVATDASNDTERAGSTEETAAADPADPTETATGDSLQSASTASASSAGSGFPWIGAVVALILLAGAVLVMVLVRRDLRSTRPRSS
ncbi:MAG: hypothetical protein ACTHZ5_06060 [Micrococcaceae bacterium]